MSIIDELVSPVVAKLYDKDRDGRLEFREWASQNLESARQSVLLFGVSKNGFEEIKSAKIEVISNAYAEYLKKNSAHFPSGATQPTEAELAKFKQDAVHMVEDAMRARSAVDKIGLIVDTGKVQLDTIKAGRDAGLDFAQQMQARIERDTLKR